MIVKKLFKNYIVEPILFSGVVIIACLGISGILILSFYDWLYGVDL